MAQSLTITSPSGETHTVSWGRGNVTTTSLFIAEKAVGERIKAIRLRNGMTQSRLAEKLDYTSERQLQRIESGETSCSVDKLMELAQILGVSTDYLLFGYESACRDDMEKYMSGKLGREKEYISRVLDVVVSNMGVLLNGE